MIRRGLAALDRAMTLGAPGRRSAPTSSRPRSPPAMPAPKTPQKPPGAPSPDWYDLLAQLGDNPVVEVNRAVAHGRAYSPEEGLAVLDDVADHRSLAGLTPGRRVRGDLLSRAGRHDRGGRGVHRAAALTANEAERAVLTARAVEARSHG